MHMLNLPSFTEALFNLFKSFMKEKMRKRLIIHKQGDLSRLHQIIGSEVLPVEYGGSNGTLQELTSKIRRSGTHLPEQPNFS